MIKSLFEVLEDRSVTDFTVDGKCSNCGACCANLLHLTENEKAVIHRYIQKHQIREAETPLSHLGQSGGYDLPFPLG